MLERNPDDVTLNTLHEDMTKGAAEMRSGFGDLKATLIAGDDLGPRSPSSPRTC